MVSFADTIGPNVSFSIVAVSGAGHRYIGNTLLEPTCNSCLPPPREHTPFCGTLVFGAGKGMGSKGDIFASNIIRGNTSLYRPGNQGTINDNWFFDNQFVAATKAEVFERYLGDKVSEISIVDFGDIPLNEERAIKSDDELLPATRQLGEMPSV